MYTSYLSIRCPRCQRDRSGRSTGTFRRPTRSYPTVLGVAQKGVKGSDRKKWLLRVSDCDSVKRLTISSVNRVARYKVYAHTNTSRLHTCHRWLTCAPHRSVLSAEDEEAHLIARADRAAGWRESRHQYGIDHGSALLQRQRAQQQPGQGPGWPSGRCANRLHSHDLWTHVPPALERFKLFASDQDGYMRTTRAHVPVQSA